MNKWDFGGSLRLREEVKEGFGIQGVGAGPTASLDFRDHGADVDNEYLLSRLRLRLGYTDKWWSALIGGAASTEFLGTQGDVWDTQEDMFMCFIGAICAQLFMRPWQDRQLRKMGVQK